MIDIGNVLIFDKNPDVILRIVTMLRATKKCGQIVTTESEDECLSLLKKRRLDLLFINLSDPLFRDQYMSQDEGIKTKPTVILSQEEIDSSLANHSQLITGNGPLKQINIIMAVSDVLEQGHETVSGKYLPIKWSTITGVIPVPCDIYLKLNGLQYVKIVSNGGALSATALSKYSKTDAFYVTRDDFIATSESLFPHPGILDRESSSGLFIDNSMAVMNEIQDSLGLNENLLELSSNLAGDIGQFFKNSSIEDMLSSFKRSKDRYVYDHSLLTSVFASAMASGAEWSNPKNIEKLVLASLVHDLGFTHPRLALVELNHKTSLNLSKEQKTEILNHPAKMAKLLSVSGTVPSEVINIVAKHHEMEELGNYPLGLNARGFSILECVFIIAHQFSNELYRVSFRVDKISVAIERVLQFPDTGNFKQAKQLFVSAIAKKYHFKQSI